MIKRLLISILVINLMSYPVLALNFDLSADEEIRKQYNPSKLEQDMGLPPMPKIDAVQTQSVKKAPSQIKKTQSVTAKAKPTDTQMKPIMLEETSNSQNSITNEKPIALDTVKNNGR